jgi:hypothetical protein
MCRVIDAFVAKLSLSELGFERAQAAETGRPGYDPRDLLKLYLYGYLNKIHSSQRLEAECRRNVGMVLWHSLWRWAKQRHPNKSPSWIVDRYWHRFGRRSWCFAILAGSNAQGLRSVAVRLVDPTEIPIRRYIKVKSDANPFDQHWRVYFESRKRFR